jgi:hypothetical protein
VRCGAVRVQFIIKRVDADSTASRRRLTDREMRRHPGHTDLVRSIMRPSSNAEAEVRGGGESLSCGMYERLLMK